MVSGIEEDGTQLIAHAVTGNHITGRLRRLLDISGGSGRNIVKEQFFGNPSAQSHDDTLIHFRPGFEVLQIFLRAEQCKTAGHTARNNGDIVNRIHILQVLARDCMA